MEEEDIEDYRSYTESVLTLSAGCSNKAKIALTRIVKVSSKIFPNTVNIRYCPLVLCSFSQCLFVLYYTLP